MTKRVYLPRADSDGFRVLVDGIWPRGMPRDKADVDLWLREIAPSRTLRQWYRHDPGKWQEFQQRYFKELDGNVPALDRLTEILADGPLTLVFSSRETQLNNASALKIYLENTHGR